MWHRLTDIPPSLPPPRPGRRTSPAATATSARCQLTTPTPPPALCTLPAQDGAARPPLSLLVVEAFAGTYPIANAAPALAEKGAARITGYVGIEWDKPSRAPRPEQVGAETRTIHTPTAPVGIAGCKHILARASEVAALSRLASS
jgi:hypothetical protein